MSTVDPFEQFLDDEGESAGAAPPGAFIPQSLYQEPIPEANEENLVCLRGPCRYYMEVVQRFEAGNTQGTLESDPKLTNRFCRMPNLSDIDLTDSCVYRCTSWDPIDSNESEYVARELRRKNYQEKGE